jgi:hypothetical protein
MNDQYRNAIGSVESSNNYGAIGPETDDGDRAYGRYQVMGENIPEWTKQHLGVEMTPEQFLADKAAQDKVFDGVTSGYYKKYGNVDDVTSSWFSGRPKAEAGDASDGYNTTPQYLAKVNKLLGTTAAVTPPPASGEDGAGALSANSTLGSGALFNAQDAGAPNKLDILGQGLTGIGASLAGISSPEHQNAINQQLALMKKVAADNGSWSVHVMPNGQSMLVNSKGKVVPMPGNYAKVEKDAGEEETKKLEAKGAYEKYNDTQDADAKAAEAQANVANLRKAVMNPDVTFGGAGGATATAKNLMYSLGMDPKGLTDTQAVERIATQMQLSRGKQLSGAISNYEDQLMSKANGLGLDKSRESNIAALDALDALHAHTRTLAAASRKYKAENGTLDGGWDTYRSTFAPPDAAPAQAAPPASLLAPGALPKGVRGIKVIQ